MEKIKQINSQGKALSMGCEIFTSIPVYSGEYLDYGDSFLLQTLSGATDTDVTIDAYAEEAISTTPPSNINQWYRFHTSGENWGTTTAPSTSTNKLTMLGVGLREETLESHSGMYQKLSGLLVGVEYEVTINFHYSANVGTISFSRFYYSEQNFTNAKRTPVTDYSLPSKKIRFTFTALTTNDIVFFDYSTTAETSSCFISSIEIKEQNNYQLPIIADLSGLGFVKVLHNNDGVGEPDEPEF
tara:strand:- start:8 stop:733 length:726 start_codon:yes stop_codon:yes gene_type:complete